MRDGRRTAPYGRAALSDGAASRAPGPVYFTGVVNDLIREYAATDRRLGLLAQPRSGAERSIDAFATWAADNGAFGAWRRGETFDFETWLRWIEKLPRTAQFVVVPDVVCDHDETLAYWRTWAPVVRDLGFRTAFVLQNGCTPAAIPDADAVFVGGDDGFKLGDQATRCIAAAKARGQWVHVGRVNSKRRWLWALAAGADSADGTFLRFGEPTAMLRRVRGWLDAGEQDASLAS